MTKNGCFWFQDQYLSLDKAMIPINDLGFTRGFGAFEFIRTYGRKPFMLNDHVDRLFHSLELLNLSLEYSSEKINVIIENLIEQVKSDQELYIRIYATGGPSVNGLTPEQEYASLYIVVKPADQYPKEYYEEGIKASTVKAERFLPECKYMNYLPGLIGLNKAKKLDVQEVLYLNENEEVLESVTANFFGFQNDKLITAATGILPGITRQVVLDLAKRDFSIELRPIEYGEITAFDEAFVTSTSKEILPLKSIDHIVFEEGVGPRTKRLMQLFYEHTRQLKS